MTGETLQPKEEISDDEFRRLLMDHGIFSADMIEDKILDTKNDNAARIAWKKWIENDIKRTKENRASSS